MKIIKYEGIIYGLIIRSDFSSDKKYNFLTPSENNLQLGFNYYEKDEKIKRHFHLPCNIKIDRIEEVIYLKRGKIIVKIYNEKKHKIAEEIASSGDIVYLCHGGHGFEILEKTELIEVKQGPYLTKEEDKICF